MNCVGVLGKGLALQFKRAFPEMVGPYERACAAGEVAPGVVHVVDRGIGLRPRWILNVPTKRHWRNPSRLDDVTAGARALADKVRELGIRSVAVPPLGCGNGGLDWADVRKILLTELGSLDAEVILFAPAGSPAPEDMPNRSEAPELTVERAELLVLLSAFVRAAAPFRVAERADALARIEIQKLAYLLQVFTGAATHRFERGRYGPYSHGLERELKDWEGHFVLGYGDATDKVLELQPIHLMPDAVGRAIEAVPADYDKVVDAVLDAVDGWESTYELELLATTLFTFIEGTASSAQQAYDVIAGWSHIPSHLFTARHVAIAWEHLRSTGWLSEPAPVA
ncbi:macro domain-containing protein [Kutzneria sp. 744]|uniref:type II toxin-antitoxin system antitoxin DNA ADP-ribosyl glycohydrolase DarG n=1 Tax=Kutzneria sp. (strain 744) TaxID=345341 RepID=UPI0021007771|nr:macro domain-containing protein [Kutzneria sp. 744]